MLRAELPGRVHGALADVAGQEPDGLQKDGVTGVLPVPIQSACLVFELAGHLVQRQVKLCEPESVAVPGRVAKSACGQRIAACQAGQKQVRQKLLNVLQVIREVINRLDVPRMWLRAAPVSSASGVSWSTQGCTPLRVSPSSNTRHVGRTTRPCCRAPVMPATKRTAAGAAVSSRRSSSTPGAPRLVKGCCSKALPPAASTSRASTHWLTLLKTGSCAARRRKQRGDQRHGVGGVRRGATMPGAPALRRNFPPAAAPAASPRQSSAG